jgi:hypothetical protein
MLEKMYADEPDNWQPIEEAQARKELGSYYRNVGEVIECIQQGEKARTPHAFYRWTVEAESVSAYVDYFRRGLITANEWARLENQS